MQEYDFKIVYRKGIKELKEHWTDCDVKHTGLAWPEMWRDIAENVKLPLSRNNNRYLLVVQDYFTKWADAVPLTDQTAARITGELTKIFSQFGHPDVLHSDQGRSFESTILAQTLQAFGV